MEVFLPARNQLLRAHPHPNWPISSEPNVGDGCALYHPEREGRERSEPGGPWRQWR